MLNIVSSSEIKDLKNKLSELRIENKQINEDLKKSNLEIGDWKSKVVLLESENKTLKRKIEKLEKELKNYDNAKENA